MLSNRDTDYVETAIGNTEQEAHDSNGAQNSELQTINNIGNNDPDYMNVDRTIHLIRPDTVPNQGS